MIRSTRSFQYHQPSRPWKTTLHAALPRRASSLHAAQVSDDQMARIDQVIAHTYQLDQQIKRFPESKGRLINALLATSLSAVVPLAMIVMAKIPTTILFSVDAYADGFKGTIFLGHLALALPLCVGLWTMSRLGRVFADYMARYGKRLGHRHHDHRVEFSLFPMVEVYMQLRALLPQFDDTQRAHAENFLREMRVYCARYTYGNELLVGATLNITSQVRDFIAKQSG